MKHKLISVHCGKKLQSAAERKRSRRTLVHSALSLPGLHLVGVYCMQFKEEERQANKLKIQEPGKKSKNFTVTAVELSHDDGIKNALERSVPG